MRSLFFLASAFVAFSAHALDFFQDGAINSEVQRGYKVRAGDTLAGYPIYQQGTWLFAGAGVGVAYGGDADQKMPSLVLESYSDGRWLFGQIVTVTVGRSNTHGWQGAPCGGDNLVLINRVRGLVDRCAVARITPMPVAGKEISALEIVFTESNSGGRYYQLGFVVNYEALGITKAGLSNKDSELMGNLNRWMETMLDAVVVAAGYNKSANAFDKVPSLLGALQAEQGADTGFKPN